MRHHPHQMLHLEDLEIYWFRTKTHLLVKYPGLVVVNFVDKPTHQPSPLRQSIKLETVYLCWLVIV